MVKTIITGAVISKGFGSNPAIWFSEGNKSARFKVGYKLYEEPPGEPDETDYSLLAFEYSWIIERQPTLASSQMLYGFWDEISLDFLRKSRYLLCSIIYSTNLQCQLAL